MKILNTLLGALTLLASTAAIATHIEYTGSIQTADNSLVAQTLWSDAVFSWTISDSMLDDGTVVWTYQYNWTASNKDLSHLSIETATDFTLADLISSSSSPDSGTLAEPALITEKTGDTLFGLKWNLGSDSKTLDLVLVTTWSPIWGDMFAKDGTDPNTKELVYALNSQFGSDSALPAADGNNGGWVLIPGLAPDDVTPPNEIPVPPAALLMLSGLLGLIGVARRR